MSETEERGDGTPEGALRECYDLWASGAWDDRNALYNLEEVMLLIEQHFQLSAFFTPAVGDLVENIEAPQLDSRLVSKVEGDMLWLAMTRESEIGPFPASNYRVLKSAVEHQELLTEVAIGNFVAVMDEALSDEHNPPDPAEIWKLLARARDYLKKEA